MDFVNYLKQEGLFIDEPYKQGNLRHKERLNPGINSVILANSYYVKSEKVYCHICGGHRHNKGVTGILQDETKILFGSKCAKDYFGIEVAKYEIADLKRRTKDASSRYKMHCVKSSIDEIEAWLNSYRNLVVNCHNTWVTIENKYTDPFNEVMQHLQKNNGTYVRKRISKSVTPNGKVEYFEIPEFLSKLTYAVEAIPNLTKISQNLSFVDTFISALERTELSSNPSVIRNLYRLYNNMEKAAETIDRCLEFTSQFFSENNLRIMTDLFEELRVEKLHDQKAASKRDLGKLFTRIAGSAFPKPDRSLVWAIKQVNLQDNEDELKVVSQKLL